MESRPRRPVPLVILAVALGIAAAACGGSTSDDDASSATTTPVASGDETLSDTTVAPAQTTSGSPPAASAGMDRGALPDGFPEGLHVPAGTLVNADATDGAGGVTYSAIVHVTGGDFDAISAAVSQSILDAGWSLDSSSDTEMAGDAAVQLGFSSDTVRGLVTVIDQADQVRLVYGVTGPA